MSKEQKNDGFNGSDDYMNWFSKNPTEDKKEEQEEDLLNLFNKQPDPIEDEATEEERQEAVVEEVKPVAVSKVDRAKQQLLKNTKKEVTVPVKRNETADAYLANQYHDELSDEEYSRVMGFILGKNLDPYFGFALKYFYQAARTNNPKSKAKYLKKSRQHLNFAIDVLEERL